MILPLTVIIPAYNEEARLGKTLRTVFAYLDEHVSNGEIIVVDDGSTDGTGRVAEESFAFANKTKGKLISVQPNRGKGHAVREGLLAARGAITLFSDADLSTPIEELPKLIAPIEAGDFDVTFGSRALDRTLIGTHQPWRREQGGKAINLLVRARTGLPFHDTQCGFKAFRMAVFRPLAQAARIERFGFDIELLYLAHRAGLRMKEIPVRWDHYEGSKLNPLRDGMRMLSEVQEIRRHARSGVYEAATKEARELLRTAASIPARTDDTHAAAADDAPRLVSAAHGM